MRPASSTTAFRAHGVLTGWDRTYGGGWGGWYGGGFNVYTVPYLESRLIVDMVDAKTNQLIWRGFNTDELQLDDVNKDLPDAAADVVKRFFKDTRIGVRN